jgi:hypothetical protein
MRQRIKLPERDEYTRIVARIPADREHACRLLAKADEFREYSGAFKLDYDTVVSYFVKRKTLPGVAARMI